MKLIEVLSQHRRDCYINIECEGCGYKKEKVSAYDDRNFWDNVLPSFKCEKCGESTNSLGKEIVKIGTKYAEYETV